MDDLTPTTEVKMMTPEEARKGLLDSRDAQNDKNNR